MGSLGWPAWLGGWIGCSPYNYPPFRIASTRCNGHRWNGAEGDGAKGQSADAAGSSWVPCMKIINCIGGITEIIPVLPGVVFHTVAFPFDQVLQLPAEHAAVEDFFYLVFVSPVS